MRLREYTELIDEWNDLMDAKRTHLTRMTLVCKRINGRIDATNMSVDFDDLKTNLDQLRSEMEQLGECVNQLGLDLEAESKHWLDILGGLAEIIGQSIAPR